MTSGSSYSLEINSYKIGENICTRGTGTYIVKRRTTIDNVNNIIFFAENDFLVKLSLEAQEH